MPTLAATGCSYSDYTGVEKVYAEYAAEEIGYNYLHLARGSGSNHRGVLMATKAIMEKRLVSGDILVFQYTDPHRKIIPSLEPITPSHDQRHRGQATGCPPGTPEKWVTRYGAGWSTDYKIDSWSWQGYDVDYVGKINARIHKSLQSGAINPVFELEQMSLHQSLLESLCKVNKIHFVPLFNRYMRVVQPAMTGPDYPSNIIADFRECLGPEVANRSIYELDVITPGYAEKISEDDLGYDNPYNSNSHYDSSHLSDIGHKKLGLYLAKHVKSHKLLI